MITASWAGSRGWETSGHQESLKSSEVATEVKKSTLKRSVKVVLEQKDFYNRGGHRRVKW